jgi:hypothetical protein
VVKGCKDCIWIGKDAVACLRRHLFSTDMQGRDYPRPEPGVIMFPFAGIIYYG